MVATYTFSLLQMLRALHAFGCPVIVGRVADAVGASREAARQSLQKLKVGGYVDTRRSGGRTLYAVSEFGVQAVAAGHEININPAQKWERSGYVATMVPACWQWRELQEALGTQRPKRAKGRVVSFGLDVDRLGIEIDDEVTA
jgi:DNA-binding transcriptional ArsR family regulator